MLGDVNLVKLGNPYQYWKYPFDWVKNKLEDLEFVFKALKLIEKENLRAVDKETIKTKYLLSKYFPENFNMSELIPEGGPQKEAEGKEAEIDAKSESSSTTEKQSGAGNKRLLSKNKTFVTSTKPGSMMKDGSKPQGLGDHSQGVNKTNYLDIPKLMSKLYPPPEENMIPPQTEKVERALVLKSETKNYYDPRVFDEYSKGKLHDEDLVIRVKSRMEEIEKERGREKEKERDALGSVSSQSNVKESKKVVLRNMKNDDMYKKNNIASSASQRQLSEQKSLAPLKKSGPSPLGSNADN